MIRAPLRPRDLIILVAASVFALPASGVHVVRSGDTLGGIAAANGTTISELVAANKLADPNLILVGQTLTIPGATSTGSSSTAPTATTHVVQVGDTLGAIALRYGTTVSAIAAANGISDPDRIRIGSALQISSGGGSTSGAAPSTSVQLPGQRHTVVAGDSIGSIARRYGISQADLIAWNGLVDGKIYATTRLLLYYPGAFPAPAVAGTSTHTVRSGESLSAIALRYGSSVRAIVDENGLADADKILIGQTLRIPSSAAGFVCPVPGGTFFNDWAFPRSNGRSHAGNDIFAVRGTPVLAPVDGTVTFATGSIGGKQFQLIAADGSEWYGTHMDAFGNDGQVTAGDVVGYVGDSGNALGSRPHLHFEVQVNDIPINPYPMLVESCT